MPAEDTPRYCPHCYVPLVLKDRTHCASCGKNIYTKPEHEALKRPTAADIDEYQRWLAGEEVVPVI